MDIRLKGANGIEVAREFRKQQREAILIFITGIKEYVFEAFDVSAFHYLLKPLEEKKFKEVFGRAAEQVRKQKESGKKQVFIQTRKRSLTIDQSDILYIESRAKKVEIHTTKETVEIYAAMNELERQLGESFYRCHRGYLVNMAYIVEYGLDNIRLTGGETVYLTKKKHSEFVKAYMWYLQNGGISCV